MELRLLITTLLLATLAQAQLLLPQQIHFNPSHSPKSPSSSGFAQGGPLTLQHAIHLSTTDRHSRPALYRTYTDADRLSIAALTPGVNNGGVIKTTRARALRPNNQRAYQAARRSSYYTPRAMRRMKALTQAELSDYAIGATLEWEEADVVSPDVEDVGTLAELAKMASNAYSLPEEDSGREWFDLDGKWNASKSFGWLEDGMRGHVFADPTNSTVVVAIKGTSAGPLVGGSSPTGSKDKRNDNLLFSCCCSRVNWSWDTVCDCYSGPYTCQQDCLEEAIMSDSAYYPIATDLYNNVTALYPHAQIWLTGHSLGGALASLLGLSFGVPSVSFESPGDLLAAKRLHLPLPPESSFSSSNITTHVYHTADPIAMGTCVGIASTCSIAGFALESRCHTGLSIVYDTVNVLHWAVDIRTHRINDVISRILIKDWDIPRDPDFGVAKRRWGWGWWPGGGGKKEPKGDKRKPRSRGVPKALPDEDCVDCFKWEFEEPAEAR